MVEIAEFKTRISKFLKIAPERVRDDALLTDLVNDSFALVDMVVELQEDYGARLTQENLKDVRTVNDLFVQVDSHLLNRS